MENSDFLKMVDDLPYPVAVINEKRELLHRNRLAQKLLPPPHRLRAFFQSKRTQSMGVMGEASLDGIRYYVGTAKGNEGLSAVCFLENFLPFSDQFSRLILERMQTLIWDLFPENAEEKTEGEAKALLDGIAARTHRLRSEEQSYLRLLNMAYRVPRASAACSLFGFFSHLQKVLRQRGIGLSILCPERAVVRIPPSSLSFLVLNLVQFVYLFEGVQEISVKVEPKGKYWSLALSFADPCCLADSLKDLILRQGEKDPRLLLSLPLLCALSLCREEGFLWYLETEKGKAVFSLLLPCCSAFPEAFLSEAMAEEGKDLLRMEKEFFQGRNAKENTDLF